MDIGAYGVYVCLFVALYFEVFLLISFLEKRPAGKTSSLPKRYPSVSIVVPCWNEEKTIGGTIESLLALDYPKDKLSIIVVNDGSSDGTLAAARKYEGNPQVTILSRDKGGEGKHVPLNMGLKYATSELVGCLDADSFVVKDALIETVKKFEEHPETMAVVPSMRVQSPRNMLELMQAAEYTFGIFIKKTFDNLAAISVLPGPFSIYRREVFEKIGYFKRAHNTEDMEMAFRMHKFALPIENAHTALVYTKVPRTVRKLLKQRTRWSQGFLKNSLDYWYMYFNPRFGNFGLVVLPFGLFLFFGALYTASYLLYNTTNLIVTRVSDAFATGIFPHMYWSFPHFEWFYLNTSMLMFLVCVTFVMTATAIYIGRRIAGADFGIVTFFAYFLLYGFLAPLWLARAAWGTMRARESAWR